MAYKVFISCTPEDVELARDLARRLKEKTGVEVAPLSKAKEQDGLTATRVQPALRKADEVLFLLTSGSEKSSRLWWELGLASGLGKRITPIMVNLQPEKLPAAMQRQSIKYGDLPDYFSKLALRAKRRKLGRRLPARAEQ